MPAPSTATRAIAVDWFAQVDEEIVRAKGLPQRRNRPHPDTQMETVRASFGYTALTKIRRTLLRVFMATERMDQSWYRIRAQIKSIWSDAEFGDKEMKKARGDMNKMVNLIHEKTGEPRSEIFQKISAII
jgi:hypothetical protein